MQNSFANTHLDLKTIFNPETIFNSEYGKSFLLSSEMVPGGC